MQKALMSFKRALLIALWSSGLFVSVCLPANASQNVTLTWNPSTNADVTGYNIYYGTASGVYTNVYSAGDVTNATISGLADGTTYFFAAKALDASGGESSFSNEASFVVPTAAGFLGSVASSGGAFSFYVTKVLGYQYVIQASTNMVNWVSLVTNTAPFSFSDANAIHFNRRFYRTVYLP